MIDTSQAATLFRKTLTTQHANDRIISIYQSQSLKIQTFEVILSFFFLHMWR